jgi:hypothetical protein
LHEREVALFGGDCVEALPGNDPEFSLPLHQLGIGSMGLALLNWPDLDQLIETCERLERHEFLLTVAPLPIVGGTGSNLLATPGHAPQRTRADPFGSDHISAYGGSHSLG